MAVNRVIIDVREKAEYDSGHVAGALHIPPEDLLAGAKQLEGVAKDAELVLYCRSGSRSQAAMHILATLGYTNMINGINKENVEAKYAHRH